MKLTATVLAAVCLLGAATAGANPMIGEMVYVDFDPVNVVTRIDPEPLELVDAYVVVNLVVGYVQEFRSISFRLALTPGMGDSPTYTNLIPDAVVEGDWYTGLTITADCVSADPPVAIGKLSFVYQGTPGDVTIEDHPDYPRWLINCSDELLIYCVFSHGGVGKNPLAGDCGGSPVENASWSAIKGLYRR